MTGDALPDQTPRSPAGAAGRRAVPTRWRLSIMQKLVAFRTLVLCGAATFGPAAWADTADDVADVFAGIVRYTRWGEAPPVLRICVNEQDPAAVLAITRRFAEEAAPPARVQVVARPLDAAAFAALLDCQAIYFGDLPAAAKQQPVTRLVAYLVNRPILTVGHGDDFCSYGGLFCLSAAEPGWRIRANLDSISRSGLRVNAQLLRLTQRDRGRP